MATATLAKQVGSVTANAARNKASGGGWYTPHMAAASRAVAERIPLVDLVLEIRDARIPLSSEYMQLRNHMLSSRRIIVLNKMDLADCSRTKEWISYFEQNNCISYEVNAHNKKNVRQFLNFLQAQVRQLRRNNHSFTTTMLLVGIPNVGKSALANSLHQIGRISAAEKGRLRHATVSPHPGETQDISSLKIGSYPNIYVLDTPGVLPPEISDVEVCSKLALTGAINDCLVGGEKLVQYFLSFLNSSEEYKKWSKLSENETVKPLADHKVERSSGVKMDRKRRRQYPTDHTQDFIVNDVRQALFETISSFNGNMNDERDLTELIEAEIIALKDAFRIPTNLKEDVCYKVATKLLNLYRTGRLGRYTLDSIP